jgi:predicted TIM-barrel fold metal-dependent hydrolase
MSESRNEARIVDADCHILEPPDIWKTWLPKKWQEKAPQLTKDVAGGDAWQHAGAHEPDPIGLTATPGMPFEQIRWTGVTYEEARAGCYNGAERLKDMDIDGVDIEMLYPPQRTLGHFLGDPDDDFVLAGVEAYNNFLFEEFCAPDPNRLVGLAQIPSLGIDSAVDGLRKAKARGVKGVLLSNWPSGGESVSESDDPFWAAACDEGMPVTIHINLVSRATRHKAVEAAKAAGGSRYSGSASAKAKSVGGLGSVFAVVPVNLAQLIFSGVCDRFPDLRIAWIETGVGWIPHFLEQIDDRWWRNRGWGEIPIKDTPSSYWYRNMSATFIQDQPGIRERHAVGVENMMWSSDYPHHGNDWPYSRKVIQDTMRDIDNDERDLIVGGNAVRIFGLA